MHSMTFSSDRFGIISVEVNLERFDGCLTKRRLKCMGIEQKYRGMEEIRLNERGVFLFEQEMRELK